MAFVQFVNTLQDNIYAELGEPCNVTIDSVTAGSIVVSDTIAFTGSDAAAANLAQGKLVNVLGSSAGVGAIFGKSFGDVAVSSVQSANATNPSKHRLASVEPAKTAKSCVLT